MHDANKNDLQYSLGFTIVELLVVIVVIGILAAITIISYTGISQKATIASITSDLDNASKQLKLDQVTNSAFPATLAAANNGKGILASPDTTYQYIANNSVTPQGFCITATNGSVSYKITNDSIPVVGDCRTYGQVLNLDAGNTLSYPGSGTAWTDLSGVGNNGTLMNGVGYASIGGGTLVFDGVDDYVNTTYSDGDMANTTLEAVIYDTKLTSYRSIIQINTASDDALYIGPSGYLYLWPCSSSNLTVPGNQWVYVAVVYNGNSLAYYVNDSSQVISTTCSHITNYQFIRVGGYTGGDPEKFKGNIAIAKVYNRALSASEIQQSLSDLRGRYGL